MHIQEVPEVPPHVLNGINNTSLQNRSIISRILCRYYPFSAIYVAFRGFCWYFNDRVCEFANSLKWYRIDECIVVGGNEGR